MSVQMPEIAKTMDECLDQDDKTDKSEMVHDFCDSVKSSITILVGMDAEPFVVHRTRLTAISDYFRVALDGDWQEKDSGMFLLDDVEPGLFAIFVYWIYFKTCPITVEFGGTSRYKLDSYVVQTLQEVSCNYPAAQDVPQTSQKYWSTDLTASDRTWLVIFSLYTLGDRLQCSAFKNTIIDISLARIREVGASDRNVLEIPLSIVIRWAFERTPTQAPLRKLLVDCTAELGCHEFLVAQFSGAQHLDFVLALGKTLAMNGNVVKGAERRRSNWISSCCNVEKADRCKLYHEHRATSSNTDIRADNILNKSIQASQRMGSIEDF